MTAGLLNRPGNHPAIIDSALSLPAGDDVIIVHSNLVAGSEYGDVEQTFHVRFE